MIQEKLCKNLEKKKRKRNASYSESDNKYRAMTRFYGIKSETGLPPGQDGIKYLYSKIPPIIILFYSNGLIYEV